MSAFEKPGGFIRALGDQGARAVSLFVTFMQKVQKFL